jgi:hypothetical protein
MLTGLALRNKSSLVIIVSPFEATNSLPAAGDCARQRRS